MQAKVNNRAIINSFNSTTSGQTIYFPFKKSLENCKQIKPIFFVIPNTFLNVEFPYNQLQFTLDNVNFIIVTLTNGYYNIDGYIVLVQNALQASGLVGCTITLQPPLGFAPTQLVQITATVNFRFIQWPLDYMNQSYLYLGLTPLNQCFTTLSMLVNGDEYPDLDRTSCVNLQVANINANDLAQQNNNFMFSIPITVDFGDNILFIVPRPDDYSVFLNDTTLSDLSIALYDDNLQPLYIGLQTRLNTIEFNMTFIITQ